MSGEGSPAGWKAEVLDFLTVRCQGLFSHFEAQSLPRLAATLARRDWESLVIRNVLVSPRFARELHHASLLVNRELRRRRQTGRTVIARGRLRGAILPRRTLTERVRRQDSTLWVTDPRRHVFQTPENAAIVGFLQHLRVTGLRHAGATELPGIAAIDNLLRMRPFHDVVPDPAWASVRFGPDLLKSPLYNCLWQWICNVRDSRRGRDSTQLQAHIEGWLREEDEDRLFELYALSRVVTRLHGRGWATFEVSLSRREVLASREDLVVTLLIDQSPAIQGSYAWVLSRYKGIDGRGRRPDLQLISSSSVATRTSFIEVKNTEPNEAYGRDSVVKVLGYLKDYAAIWADEPVTYPRAALLYPGGLTIRPSATSRETDEVLLTSAQFFDADVDLLLDAHLGTVSGPTTL
jgi:hypothetical protein